VQLQGNEVTEPNPVDRFYLSEEQIASGMRLACQVRPKGNLEVSILSREPLSCWRATAEPSRDLPAFSSSLPKCPGEPYGVAVDLGTTHISLSFYSLSTGQWFAGRRGLNPQKIYGTDVVARLIAANESPETALILRRSVIDAIGTAIRDVATSEGICGEQVVKAALVGNTAMLALFSGKNSHLLLQPAHWMRPIDCLPEDLRELRSDWGVHPEAPIEIMPPLAGFVGSDLLAGIFAEKLVGNGPGELFIDFGTNSEISLWDGESLWVTSAAGGPAFEGCGIGCGTPAEPGAIYRVCVSGQPGPGPEERADSGCVPAVFRSNTPGLDLEFRTIDNENPMGLCGSGIVDLIACLLQSGLLTSIGRFSAGVPHGTIVILDGNRQRLQLTKRDVDVFQRAKAAIFAAIMVLLSKAAMSKQEIRRVCVAGAFGHFLNRESAAAVGLLPELGGKGEKVAIELCGNAALRGCEELLMSSSPCEIVERLRNRARIVNLAQCGEFDDLFLEGLYLGRWADRE
jgi:uncharacterized 2Fe-2S/4Fe-4S cluster protein (DUF4445 family)